MNCVDCIYWMNERKHCYKANPETKECTEYVNKYKTMIEDMLE